MTGGDEGDVRASDADAGTGDAGAKATPDAEASDAGTQVAVDATDDDALPFSELRRRLVHLSGALVPLSHVVAPGVVPWRYVAWFCLAGAAAAAVLEVLRLSGRIEWWLFDELTRDYEQDNPAGYALYALSFATVAVALGPATTPAGVEVPLAVPAMLMLAIGDPVAGLLGSSGVEGVKGGHVLGAMFAVCSLVALPFVPPLAAGAGAAVATVADGVKPVVWGSVVDDNVTIPLGAGAVMWAVTALA